MLLYRVAERHFLVLKRQALSFGALTLMQNSLSFLIVLPVVALRGEHKMFRDLVHQHWRDPMPVMCIIFTGCAGLALGYYSIMLQSEITATSFTVLQSTLKAVTILFAMVILSEKLSCLSAIGCITSLAGSTWYGLAASRPRPPAAAESLLKGDIPPESEHGEQPIEGEGIPASGHGKQHIKE